jgi:DNA-binding beta-propeller fold protein YncE
MAGAHQIWKMPLDESEIGPYAGNGREDIVDGALLPKQPFDPDFASFAQPSGLTSDGKQLFVADSEGSSVRSVPLAPAGKVTTLIGTSQLDEGRLFTFGDVDGPPGKARLQHCLDVAYHDGRLYVADTYNHKIKSIDLKTRECKTLAGDGKQGHADLPSPSGREPALSLSKGAGGEGAEFFEPAGLSYAAGKLYVADTNNHLIRVIDLATNRVSTLQLSGL